MTQKNGFNQVIINNLMWLIASFLLAFFVWIIATNAADPIQERRFAQQIPIQIEFDDGLVMTREPRTTNARVIVRAQESVFSLLTSEDIIVEADLRGMGPGTYTVELKTEIARRAFVADTQPRQITVTLEEIQSQQVDVAANITDPVPTGFEQGEPRFSESQVLVQGAASRVQQVVAAWANLNLSDQRGNFNDNVRLYPVDADGVVVEEVTIDPQFVEVNVDIALRENVREVPIQIDIDISSLPEGYDVVSFTPDIRSVFVSGTQIPSVLSTERISLQNRDDDFEITVPILLPNSGIFILDDQQEVTVAIDIEPRIITRNFENITVESVGLGEGLDAQFVTSEITLLVTGPQALIEALSADNLQVVVDLNGLGEGVYEIAPIALNGQVQIEADNISFSPATISVTITASE